MLVSSVETVWGGLEIPPKQCAITRKSRRDKQIRLERGAEMARFNMGSTVIARSAVSLDFAEGSAVAPRYASAR